MPSFIYTKFRGNSY